MNQINTFCLYVFFINFLKTMLKYNKPNESFFLNCETAFLKRRYVETLFLNSAGDLHVIRKLNLMVTYQWLLWTLGCHCSSIFDYDLLCSNFSQNDRFVFSTYIPVYKTKKSYKRYGNSVNQMNLYLIYFKCTYLSWILEFHYIHQTVLTLISLIM